MSLTYFIVWCISQIVYPTYFRWRFYNPERVPLEGPVVLASNHASYLDPTLVGAALHRAIHYLAREDLFRLPMMGWVLPRLFVVPVDRDGGGAKGLKTILDRLRTGAAIILFPEGTRTRDGLIQRARAGIGLTVIKSSCPVVPVRVFGTFEAYGRKMRIPRPRHIAVKFGKPLDFSELRAEAQVCSKVRLKAIYQQAADEIMAAIGKLQPHEDKHEFP
jgi:1-acyl-sn-glycerol-3-phosphate acyltransferase